MLSANAFVELEKRLQQMDAEPRGLDVLKQAIEAIAASVSVEIKIQMGTSSLKVDCDTGHWIVKMEGNDYHCSYMHRADSGDFHGLITSKSAWTIVAPARHLGLRAMVAAAAQGKQ
jgi:hypothetical protein